ncbi:MAG TPA: hypothetical protein VFA87_09880 [Rhizomicrobium sp.]|nr:hypothetical protein [Rhizomicrobium sp.]
MTSTAILTDDTTAIVAEEEHRFRWGVVIAGAFAATATTLFLLTLGAGVGLALVPVPHSSHADSYLHLGAVYFLASQAFGFALGGYIVGRLIGPEAENTEEEEFRAGAHGLVMWAFAVVAGFLLMAAASGLTDSSIAGALATRPANQTLDTRYWVDVMFGPSRDTGEVQGAKNEARRILSMNAPGQVGDEDNARLVRLVSGTDGISEDAARTRVNDAETRWANATRNAKRIAAIAALWTAAALLFGAVIAVAASIAARWQDDRIAFSMKPRR